jgi:hypothetical protein
MVKGRIWGLGPNGPETRMLTRLLRRRRKNGEKRRNVERRPKSKHRRRCGLQERRRVYFMVSASPQNMRACG